MAATQIKSKVYLKNVGKSFGYAALDVFEHYNPTLTNLYKSSKEAVTEAKRSMREAKMQAQQMEVESDKGGLSYILEDLASGKWYNKDRETENDRYLSKIEKEDWGDDTTAEAVAETAKDIMKQNEQKTREISSSMSGAAQNISTSIGYASAQSAEYIVKNYAAQSRALYSLTSNGFDRVTNVLLSINHSIDGLASMGEGLNAHMKNSAIFYINATQSLNRIDTNLEKLVKLQEAAHKSPRGISRRNVKGMENLVDADGNIDLVAYMKMVKDNMDQYKSLADALKNNKEDWIGNRKGGNMLSNTVVSVVDAMLPKMTKEAMKIMNETLRDAMTAGLARGSVRAARSKNPIANILGDMFLPKDGYKDKIDTANYEKGAVSWDGIARKSLVEVIPTYLAKIYAALGGEEKYYDYEAGKFVKLEAIKQGHEYDKKVAAVRAGGKMRSDILTDIRKNAPAARQAQLENEVESFFLQAFVDGYDFVEIASLVNDASFRKKYGITRESAKYIINYINSSDPTKARRSIGFASGVARGRNEFGNTMRRREASGTSNLNYLGNDFSGGPSGSAANGFATMADNFGKTQAYYLRGIYMMTGNIYGAMQQGGILTQSIRPDRRSSGATYFNPDTGRYSRRKPAMTRTTSGRATSRGSNIGSNSITIEDRAKYMGMTDDQILEAKKRESLIKKYQSAFSGQQLTPIAGTGSDGQPKPRSKFASALSKAKDIYEAPFAAMTDMINSFTLAVNNMFWGNKDKKGLIDQVSDYLSGLMKKIFGDETGNGVGLSQAMKDEWSNIKTKVKSKATNFMGNLGARNRAVRDRQMAEAVYAQVTGQSDVPGHARGRQITKTGLIAVSEGELVIPSEFNPYYHGTTNKRQQIANENRIINKFYGAFAEGGTVGGAFANGQFTEEVDPITGKKVYKFVKPDGTVITLKNKAEYAKRLAQYKMKQAAKQIDDSTGVITHAADGANLLGSGIMDFIKASLFGTERQQEEDKKKITMKLTDIFKEMGQEKGAMGIGAIAGTGVSLLTGAVVGPLAGAALGAGTGLLMKSEKIQKMLFGEVDENGNYEKEIGNFIMKKLPNIGITAGLGMVGGTLLGSPVLGLIAGSAIGFAGQSEKVKSRLFGEMDEDGVRSKGGLINKEIRDKIKKAAPNIAAGGIAGLLVGPFGLAGNIIVGSALGYLSTGEKFHQYFFGDGKDDKGLAGIIHDKIVKGLDDLIHNTGNAMKGWLRKTGAKIGSKLMGLIDKAQNKYNSGQARGLTKAIGWAASVPGRAIKGATNKVGDLVQGLANRRRARNLAEGYDVWNAEERRNATAAERLAMRSDNDISSAANMDRVIAGADAEQLAQLRNVLTDLRDPKLAFNRVKNKSNATLYSELMEAGVDRKLIDKIIKESGSTNGAIRLEGLLQGTGYDKEKLQAIRKAFNKSDKEIRAAKDTKTATRGNLALLKDKFGINLEGSSNADIANYLKLIDYDNKMRFGENGSDLNAKEEKYQDNVVTLLSDMNKNISMFTEYITGKRTETGRYDANIDREGNAHFWRHGMDAVSAEEAIAGAKGQRDIMEFGRDTKDVIATTTTKVITTVTEPVKDAVVGTFDFVKEKVATPLLESVKAIHATAKDLYGIGVKGFNEANPNINTDEYYGPTSGIDVVNRGQRLMTRASYLGARLKRGASDVVSAVRGKAEGGPGGSKQTFIDLLAEKVIEKTGGIKQFFSKKNGQDGDGTDRDENVKFHFDMFGNVHKFFTNKQGEPDVAENDSATKKSKSIMDKFVSSVHSIPGIGTAIAGLGGLLGSLKDKLVGTEKEPGLLDKLFSGLFGDSGFLSGLFALFTGKGTNKLLSGTTLTWVAQNLLGPGLLAAGLGGALDDVMHEATGGAYGASENTGYFDKNGNPLTKKDGKYYDANGNEVSYKDVEVRKKDADRFSDKLWQNTTRGVLTNTSSVASKVMSKTAVGKGATNVAGKIANVAKTSWDDAAGAAAKSAAVMELSLPITDGIKKFTNMLKKVKILAPLADSLDNMAAELCEKACKAITSGTAKKLASLASNLVVWAKVAFIVVDFTTGYQDANQTLGITAEPTFGQKVVSGLIRAIKNFIPVIGTLIPDSLLVDIFCKYVAPAFGIDVDELMKQREEADAEVAQYNAEHGTDLTFEQYNKQVLGNYTWTEKIGNGIKTGWNKVKDGAKNLGSNIKSGWNNVKEKAGQAKDWVGEKFTAAKDFVKSGFSKIGDGVKSIADSGKYLLSLPKTIHEDTKAMVYDPDSSFKEFFNIDKYKQDDKNGLFNGIISAVAMTSRVASLGSMLVGAVGKRIGKFFGEIKDKVVNIGSAFVSLDLGITKKALQGNIGDMFAYVGTTMEDPENPLGWVGKVYGYINAGLKTPLALVSKAGKAIGDWFGKVKEKVVTTFTTLSTLDQNITAQAKSGNISGMFSTVSVAGEDPDNPLGFLGKTYGYINAAGKVPLALISMAGNAIGGWFTEKVDAFKGDMNTLDSAKSALKSMSNDSSSSVKDIFAYTTTFDKENIFNGIFKAVFGFQKIFYGAAKLIGGIFDTISGVVDGVKNTISNITDSIKDKLTGAVEDVKEGWENTKEKVSGWAQGAWDKIKGFITGSGSGFVSQYDPRYQGYMVSGQNFAAKGCGPAVAAMAGRALGKNISVGDAVAGSAGYQNGGGVSIDYFQQMLGSRGINTRYISGGSSADLYNSIASGEKVVLLGRDPYNTSKENSPFGPNNHYVLATGLDRRGNVIINDPENNGPRAYNPAILNSAKFGVAGSNSGIRRSHRSPRFMVRYSGGAGYDTAIAKQVWAFFTGLGYSPECTAGIMGNLYAESGMKPDVIQGGGKGPAAGICQWENYNTKSGRWKAMSDYAASRGKSWTDLDSQLNYIHKELASSDINNRMMAKYGTSNFSNVGFSTSNAMSYSEWKVCKDIKKCCYLFEVAFERAGKPHMDRRMEAASAYYNLYSGKTYTYTGTVDTSSGSVASTDSTGTTSSNSTMGGIWNIVSDFGTIFSNAFNKVLGNGESTNVSGSTGTNGNYTGSSDFAVVNAAVGDGNAKQKALAQKLLDIQGKLSYSMSGARNPDKGSADCSSTVNWAYKKVTGTDIGNNTAAILSDSDTEIIDMASGMNPSSGGTNSSGPNVSKLMPGDILLYSRPTSGYTSGRKYRVGHVEMYVGNGKRIGHGGGMGPKVTDVTTDSKRYIMAKRLKGITAAGSGLVSYEDLANYAGGSSGVLMKARPGSINNMPVRVAGGRLVPVGNFTAGASTIASQTQTMLSNLGANAAKSSGISPELVTRLLTSITQILERIANNTAPVNQIYQALVAYIQSGGNSGISEKTTPIKVPKSQNNNQQNVEPEIDSGIMTLVGVLAELAKG